jgi:hypothetical protein
LISKYKRPHASADRDFALYGEAAPASQWRLARQRRIG